MSSRGQASIEFVFVMAFMLVVIIGIILPLSQSFQSSLDDVGRAGSVSTGVKQFDYAFRLMTGSNADGTQVVSVYLPRDSHLDCDPVTDDLNISLPLHLSVFTAAGAIPSSCQTPSVLSGYAMDCEKSVPLPPASDLHCNGSATDSFIVETGGAGFAQSFKIGVTYIPGLPPAYVIDVNVG